jgi:hypothetical protein
LPIARSSFLPRSEWWNRNGKEESGEKEKEESFDEWVKSLKALLFERCIGTRIDVLKPGIGQYAAFLPSFMA